MGRAPTGKALEVVGIRLLRREGGTLAAQTVVGDALGLLQQRGAVPPPAARYPRPS